MNFVRNHAPGAGSIARPVGQQSSDLPLYLGCLYNSENINVILCTYAKYIYVYTCHCTMVREWILETNICFSDCQILISPDSQFYTSLWSPTTIAATNTEQWIRQNIFYCLQCLQWILVQLQNVNNNTLELALETIGIQYIHMNNKQQFFTVEF